MDKHRHGRSRTQRLLLQHFVIVFALYTGVEGVDMEPAQKLMQPMGPRLTSPLYMKTFPFTLCRRNITSPFTMEFISSMRNNNGTSRHCFQLTTNPTFHASSSTTTDACEGLHDLRGIEFNIWARCRRMIRAVTFNATNVHTMVSCFSKRGCVFKVTRGLGQPLTRYLDLKQSKAASVCFTLIGTCGEGLHKFCKAADGKDSKAASAHAPLTVGSATCELAFFDKDRQCCGA